MYLTLKKIDILHSRLIRADFIALILSNIFNLPVLINVTDEIKSHFSYQHNWPLGQLYKTFYSILIN